MLGCGENTKGSVAKRLLTFQWPLALICRERLLLIDGDPQTEFRPLC